MRRLSHKSLCGVLLRSQIADMLPEPMNVEHGSNQVNQKTRKRDRLTSVLIPSHKEGVRNKVLRDFLR